MPQFVPSKFASAGIIVCLLLITFCLPRQLMSQTTNLRTNAETSDTKKTSLAYPNARRGDTVDEYPGAKVADPYRWLEDPDSTETRAWIEAENKITFGYLNDIPQRAAIKNRLTKLWNFERYSPPEKEANRYFYFKNDGLQNQSVLYTVERLDSVPRVLLDPNKLSTDGTVALSGTSVTDDGKLLAYGLSSSGSDWQQWKVRDVATGADLPDTVDYVKFSGASWTKDGKGFFYSRYDTPNEGTKLEDANYFQKLYFHKLGTPQAEDVLVYKRDDEKEWGFGGGVTEDGRYLIVSVWKGTQEENRIFYKDLRAPDSEVVKLVDNFDNSYDFIGNDGDTFFFRTNRNAPRLRVIAIDTRKPDLTNAREVIPQQPETLGSVGIVGNMFIASYMKDAHSQIKFYDMKGKFAREVALPGLGTVSGFSGKRDDTETFYSFTSFTAPATVYRYDIKTGKSTIVRQPKVDFNSADYETKQVFFASKDGTKIPMFITHRKGLKMDGTNPTYLYGYGGFNVSLTPGFSISNLVWMEMGGVYAQPTLRGGGEYGEDWHKGGMKLKKQNVFDDFIGAAEWLIANKYTTREKLAIGGGSNGGLLVGAAMTQRPELFRAALPAVGVMDMLRFHKFTIGWGWQSDYGSPDKPDEFAAIYAYSPLHNLKPGTSYPATMVTTADHDDRVVPAHSFKFAAALQAAHKGDAPVLIRIETKAGHGAGKPTAKVIEEAADRWAFLVRNLGMEQNAANLKVATR